ncbi:MAG: hypothetical protein LBG59_08070 [Candidatus Peribacteria bacterium]|jgi:hypothetical protein|nr:hypothetical protein [Candidatus Peribacteria bacterium]
MNLNLIKFFGVRTLGIFAVVLVCFAYVMSLSSCTKDDIVVSTPAEEIVDVSLDSPTTRASSGNYFGVSETILTNFVHYCQRQAGPAGGNYPNATGDLTDADSRAACNPASYMMAAACLAHYKDGNSTSYNATGSKLSGLVSGFKAYNTPTDTERWKSVITARDYCDNTSSGDGGWLDGTYLPFSSSQRSSAKSQLEAWLASDKFVLISLLAYVGEYAKPNQNVLFVNNATNPDLSSTVSTSNYIRVSSGTNIGGHVVLLIRIDKDDNSPEGGVVTYIDPLSTTRATSNRKYVSYKRFLDSMLAQNGAYLMTAIALK